MKILILSKNKKNITVYTEEETHLERYYLQMKPDVMNGKITAD